MESAVPGDVPEDLDPRPVGCQSVGQPVGIGAPDDRRAARYHVEHALHQTTAATVVHEPNYIPAVPRRRRQSHGLERVLGTPALFATAYGHVGSTIYYALGVTAAIA